MSIGWLLRSLLRTLARSIGVLSGLLVLMIVTGHLRPSPLSTFLTQDGCIDTCWRGIQPGRTNSAEALAILRELPYVDQDSLYMLSSIIQWRWSPDFDLRRFDKADSLNQIVLTDGVVQSLELAVGFPAGDLVGTLGAPHTVNVSTEYGRVGLLCPFGVNLIYGSVTMRYVVLSNCFNSLPDFSLNTSDGRYMIAASRESDATSVVLHRFGWGGFKSMWHYVGTR